MKTSSSLLAGVLLIATSPIVNASILAGWDFNGLSGYGNSPLTPTTSLSSLTIGGLTRGSGISDSGTAANNAWGGNGLDASSLAAAIDAGDYASFKPTAATGYILSISGIDACNIRRSSTGPTTGQWQYQVGANEFVTIGTPITWGGTTTSAGNPRFRMWRLEPPSHSGWSFGVPVQVLELGISTTIKPAAISLSTVPSPSPPQLCSARLPSSRCSGAGVDGFADRAHVRWLRIMPWKNK